MGGEGGGDRTRIWPEWGCMLVYPRTRPDSGGGGVGWGGVGWGGWCVCVCVCVSVSERVLGPPRVGEGKVGKGHVPTHPGARAHLGLP